MNWRQTALLAAMTWVLASAHADEPMIAQRYEWTTPSGKIVVSSDPDKSITEVFRRDTKTGKREKLWSYPKWLTSTNVTEDGEALVAEFNGANLLPRDLPDDFVLLTFIRNGKIIRTYTLIELVRKRDLRETVSHVNWRKAFLIDDEGRVLVETESGDKWFEAKTGKQISEPKNSSIRKQHE